MYWIITIPRGPGPTVSGLPKIQLKFVSIVLSFPVKIACDHLSYQDYFMQLSLRGGHVYAF